MGMGRVDVTCCLLLTQTVIKSGTLSTSALSPRMRSVRKCHASEVEDLSHVVLLLMG